MKKSEILWQARGLIERKTKHSVCTALIGVVVMTPGCRDQAEQLRKWVKNLLGSHDFYEGWLLKNHPGFVQEHNLQLRAFEVGEIYDLDVGRPGRLQWMSWMIEYWEDVEAKETKWASQLVPKMIPAFAPVTLFDIKD